MTSASTESVKVRESGEVKADRLILVNLSIQSCDAWLDVVRKAGQPWHEDIINDLDKAESLLKDLPQAHALICYDSPEKKIASCIDKGRLPSQALANWFNFSEALLTLYRDNFQRVTLVRREALDKNDQKFFEHLKVRTGIALGRVAVKLPVKEEAVDEQQYISHRLIAVQALQDPASQQLGKELDASTLPLCKGGGVLDFADDAYAVLEEGLRKETDFTNDEHELLLEEKERLLSENELLVEQLHKVQCELERYALDEKRREGKITRLQHDISRKNEKLHGFSQKHKRLAAQLQEVRQQLKGLKKSKSWKITAPLRKITRILGKGGKS